jgi:hypothetical protein
MKGLKNWAAAVKKVNQEAGIVGRPQKNPVGSFLCFKRRKAPFELCRKVDCSEWGATKELGRDSNQTRPLFEFR